MLIFSTVGNAFVFLISISMSVEFGLTFVEFGIFAGICFVVQVELQYGYNYIILDEFGVIANGHTGEAPIIDSRELLCELFGFGHLFGFFKFHVLILAI
jgi:hypothetical protein